MSKHLHAKFSRFALTGVLLGGLISAVAGIPAQAQALSQEEANEIATDAYVYFYPLVTMDLTRKQLTNLKPGDSAYGGPANWFTNVRAYPAAGDKSVVRPNFDTLYSSAWLDLGQEPVVVSAPNTNGRYYLLPMLDMWTNVFASPGWRTTGTEAAHFLIAPPGWRPDLRERFVEEFKLPKETQRIDAACLDYRPYQDRRPGRLPGGEQDSGRLQGHAAVAMAPRGQNAGGQDRSKRRHQNAAEDRSGYNAGCEILCLCG
jgi:hypothetical protein